VFGAGGGTNSYREVEEADLIVLWGSNARETHPIFFHHVLKGVRRGARLIVVDPRRTVTAQWADTWVGLNVGTDIALSNAMAGEILAKGLEHRQFIENATTGFEAYRASVAGQSLADAASVTGVPADVVGQIARDYAKADRAIICWTLGIT
jgi:formate dehydrogenase major subunit